MNRKKTWVTLGLLVVFASANFLGKEVPPSGHKNLQVLPQNISDEKLDKIMDDFCAALNVKCGFCHVKIKDTDEWDFAADTKGHKKEARDMMRMTNDLNSKYFGVDLKEENPKLAVTCYTCHRGEEYPVFAPKPINALDSLRKKQ